MTRNERQRSDRTTRLQKTREIRDRIALFDSRSSYRAIAAEMFLEGERRSTLDDSRLYYRKNEREELAESTTAEAETAKHTVERL